MEEVEDQDEQLRVLTKAVNDLTPFLSLVSLHILYPLVDPGSKWRTIVEK